MSEVKFAIHYQGRLRPYKTIEDAVAAVGLTSRTIEVFEMKSVGHYRRKVEVEKVEKTNVPEREVEDDDEDEVGE